MNVETCCAGLCWGKYLSGGWLRGSACSASAPRARCEPCQLGHPHECKGGLLDASMVSCTGEPISRLRAATTAALTGSSHHARSTIHYSALLACWAIEETAGDGTSATCTRSDQRHDKARTLRSGSAAMAAAPVVAASLAASHASSARPCRPLAHACTAGCTTHGSFATAQRSAQLLMMRQVQH